MGSFIYNIFLLLYGAAFKIAALFNRKARLGIHGREISFEKIRAAGENRGKDLIWMHCASLGEFEQGRPVLESLKQKYPGVTVALSFFSASGYEVMEKYAGADQVFYLPMDSISNARRLLDILKPTVVLWVKYEFWYYYLKELKARNIPLLLVSGIFRDNHPFFKWYGGIWRNMLKSFTHFFLQNARSAELLGTLGFKQNVTVTGDTRFDRVIEIARRFEPIPLIEAFCMHSRVIVAGSTWEDDEAELVHYVKANPEIRFIIAPHEIDVENLKDVKKEFAGAVFYSELLQVQSPAVHQGAANVLIIDNVGMLSRLYRYADITYVGGGFGADGVHNVLEAAVYGKPVIYGPEFEKYAEAVGLADSGGGIAIQNALELEKVLNELWKDQEMLAYRSDAAKNYVYGNAGASNKIVGFVQENRLLTS